MQAQATISAGRLKRRVGKTLTVLVDDVRDDVAVARSRADAPEIDGLVYIDGGSDLTVGQFARVKVRRTDEHDLYGTLVPD